MTYVRSIYMFQYINYIIYKIINKSNTLYEHTSTWCTVQIFFCGLFKDAVSLPHYIKSYSNIVDEKLIGNDLKRP
jgi:hypothetical protein